MTTGTLTPNTMSVVGILDLTNPNTELRFADGRSVLVPTALLQQEEAFTPPQSASPVSDDAVLIPLVEERLEVGKRVVEIGKVYLHKSSEAYDVAIDEPLAVSTWKVQRITRNEVVAEAPALRREGSTTIYSLVEERLILTKELVLVEEIHVSHAGAF